MAAGVAAGRRVRYYLSELAVLACDVFMKPIFPFVGIDPRAKVYIGLCTTVRFFYYPNTI